MQRDLVVRAQSGDVEAFSALAHDAIPRLHAIAFRITQDQDGADDATQQALIAAWDHLPSLRDPSRFDAWTYRLVVRSATREARRGSQRGRVRILTQPESAGLDPSDALEQRDELERAFRRLSPEHRAVLVLHHYADLPLAEIAEILGVPTGTVGSRLHNAARRLRLALGSQARATTLSHEGRLP